MFYYDEQEKANKQFTEAGFLKETKTKTVLTGEMYAREEEVIMNEGSSSSYVVMVSNQIKNKRGKKFSFVDINLASLAERFNGKKVRITIQEVKEKKVVKKKESKNNVVGEALDILINLGRDKKVDKQTAGWVGVIGKGRE